MRIKMLCLALTIASTIGGRGHPSDERLIAALTMAQQESQLRRIVDTWHCDKEGNNHYAAERGLLSAERWAAYRDLFDALDLDAGVSIGDGEVFLERSCIGLSVSGSTKGFAFLPTISKARIGGGW